MCIIELWRKIRDVTKILNPSNSIREAEASVQAVRKTLAAEATRKYLTIKMSFLL